MEKALLDFFLNEKHKQSLKSLQQAKLLLHTSLLTSLFSISYLIISVVIDFKQGAQLMIFNVIGFVALPLLLKTRMPLNIFGNIYVFIGAIGVAGVIYFSGGLASPVLPWLVASPIISLLVVNRVSAWFWTSILSLSIFYFGYLASIGVTLESNYNITLQEPFSVLAIVGLLLILFTISLVFERNKNRALEAFERKNEELLTTLDYLEDAKTKLQLSKDKVLEKNQELEEQKAEIMAQRDLIEEHNKKLKRLDEEKNYVMNVLAHDLKNPINHIIGFASLLKMESPDLSEDGKEYIERIVKSTGKSKDLIDKLLDVEMLEEKQLSIDQEKVDIAAVLTNVINEQRHPAGQKGIHISLDVLTDSPMVSADKIYLGQIFENVISNAIKFSERDSKIEIKQIEDGNIITTEIKDEGPGISEGEIKLLFKKFTKLSARPTAGEGSTGLGLSIVKKYVELMDGKVWCESEVGKGSKFIIEFPTISE